VKKVVRALFVAATIAATSIVATPLAASSTVPNPVSETVSAPTETPAECTITGTNRSETLVGTSGDDVICGLGGKDTIKAGEGNDIVYGGAGNDRVWGGTGDDEIVGNAGKDSLDGGSGNDSVHGGSGNDVLGGGNGDDAVLGDEGKDNLLGGNGDDALDGGPGTDGLRSGSGDDTCAHDAADRQFDSCTVDAEAPEIRFSDSNLTGIEAGTTAVFRWVVEDDSGVAMTWAAIGGPPGWITEWCGFAVVAQQIGGTLQSGTYELRCDLPANAVNESYTLFVGASDALGNSVLNWAGFDFTVVGGSSDNRVPEILEIRLPTTVSAGQTFTVEVDVRDESGTAGVYSWFLGAAPDYYSNENGLFIPADGPADLIAGDLTDGTWRQSLTVSQSVIPGEYRLLLSIRDTVGNRAFDTTEYVVTVTE